MRTITMLPHRFAWLNFSALLSVKDATVPYLTGAIELEDPFLACATNGLDMYQTLQGNSDESLTKFQRNRRKL